MNDKIEFVYLNKDIECGFNDKQLQACCCKCVNHYEVFKHCCHSPREEDCVCSESLGFYICCVLDDKFFRANLSSQHGMCERFIKRDKTDEEMKIEHNENMKKLRDKMEKYKNKLAGIEEDV